MNSVLVNALNSIPSLPQRQDSVADQLTDLVFVANRLGMHDAADAISQMFGNLGNLRYGCHADLEEGASPDGCVIDENRRHYCVYADRNPDLRKEQCQYWKIIAKG